MCVRCRILLKHAGVTAMQVMIKFLGWAILFYVGYCGFLFALQRQMIFPRSLIAHSRGSHNDHLAVEKIWHGDGQGGGVESWYLPPLTVGPPSRSPAVIFAHGNAELIDFCAEELQPFTVMGIGVLLVEYPGYGRSSGTPSQKTITAALKTAYDALVARKDVDPAKIVFYGRSLGGGAVSALAVERQAAALILTSTFTGVRPMAAKYLVPGFLVLDPFDNLSVVRNYDRPVLIVHGRYDDIIPFHHGEILHKASKQSTLLAYDCGHNDCPPDWNVFWRDIEDFLRGAGIIDGLPQG